MNDIMCPNCTKAFKVDEAGFADILKQVRDQQFETEIKQRLEVAEKDKKNAVQIAEAKLKNTSLKSFEVLNCNGWGRVDIILDKNNKPWVIELNTVPGMTEHSLVPMAAEAENIGFNDLVLKILDTSFK